MGLLLLDNPVQPNEHEFGVCDLFLVLIGLKQSVLKEFLVPGNELRI